MKSDFRTDIRVQLWVTKDLGLTSIAPNFTFEGRAIDTESRVILTEDHEEVTVTLWNIADPRVTLASFRRDYIIAVDLSRTELASRTPQYTRVCLARIKARKVLTSDDNMDIGYEIKAAPISETLQEIPVKLNFPVEKGPYPLRNVMQEILGAAGIGAFSILLQENYMIPNYTGDGPIFSELKRVAGKAGVPVGVWMRGGNIIVSDRYLLGRIYGDDAVLHPTHEEGSTVQPQYPVQTPEAPQVGDGQDLSQQYEAQPTEADQVALDGAVSSDTYRLELPLTPDVFKGDTIGLKGRRTLALMGFQSIVTQFFNVVGVEHTASSENESQMDITVLTLTLRAVDDEEAPTQSQRST